MRDLPPHLYGIDPGHNFKPTYEILPSHRKVVSELHKLADKAPIVYLATSRYAYAFMFTKCLVEWYLQAQKGPATAALITISPTNYTFWTELYKGHTIGACLVGDEHEVGTVTADGAGDKVTR